MLKKCGSQDFARLALFLRKTLCKRAFTMKLESTFNLKFYSFFIVTLLLVIVAETFFNGVSVKSVLYSVGFM